MILRSYLHLCYIGLNKIFAFRYRLLINNKTLNCVVVNWSKMMKPKISYFNAQQDYIGLELVGLLTRETDKYVQQRHFTAGFLKLNKPCNFSFFFSQNLKPLNPLSVLIEK